MTIECNAEQIERRLRERFTPWTLEVIDESAAHAGHVGANETGEGTHFRVRISCQAFNGLTKVKQHRLLYDALDDFFAAGLHALALQTSAEQP